MGSVSELTELLRPFLDFLYYAPRALKIKSKAGAIVPFELNKAQLYLHGKLEEQKRITGRVRALVPKMRQGGVSTYIEARLYHRTSMWFGQRAFILTHLQEATDNLFSMTRRFHEHCPKPLQPSAKNESASHLNFDKLDSEFSVATARSKGTGRSATAQLFHGSEVAYWENADEHMAGIGQVVPDEPGTEIILESTGNGEGNLFYSMVMDALAGRSNYQVVFIPWFWADEYRKTPPAGFVPDGDEADYAAAYGLDMAQVYWRRMKIIDDFRGDAALFDQEYPAELAHCFRRQATESYIPVAMVQRARRTQLKDEDWSGAPKVMGVDPAEFGDDDTCIVKRQGRKVHPYHRYHGKSTMEVVGIVGRLADAWQPDAINVDCTGIGSGVADRLTELGYPVNRVHFGENAIDHNTYDKRADEMWAEGKKWLEDLPNQLPDEDLAQFELTNRGYGYDSSQRLKLESKKHMKKRGLKSPDFGDAWGLTFAVPIAPVADSRWRQRRGHVRRASRA